MVKICLVAYIDGLGEHQSKNQAQVVVQLLPIISLAFRNVHYLFNSFCEIYNYFIIQVIAFPDLSRNFFVVKLICLSNL